MPLRLWPVDQQVLKADGTPDSGARLFFYETGTTTLKSTFNSPDLTVENPNPIPVDVGGFPVSGSVQTEIWGDGDFRLDVSLSDGSARTYDPLTGAAFPNVLGVATYAALTGLSKSGLSDGEIRQVNGRTSAGDIEPVNFQWRASSTDAANTGTILEADEGGDGRWHLLFEGPVKVSWFGAFPVASGTPTSSTAEVTNALAAAAGGVLLFDRPGIYGWIDEQQPPADTKVMGLGDNVTRLKAIPGGTNLPQKAGRGAQSCPAFAVLNDNVEITGMTIEAAVGVATEIDVREGAGIWVDGCSDVFLDVTVEDCREFHVACGGNNQVTGLRGNVRVNITRNTLRTSHFTNMFVLTLVDDIDLSIDMFAASGLGGNTTVTAGLNLEGWGGANPQSVVNNARITLRGLSESGVYNAISMFSPTIDNVNIDNCVLENTRARVRANVGVLRMSNITIANLTGTFITPVVTTVDEAFLIDESAGVAANQGQISIRGLEIQDVPTTGLNIVNNAAPANNIRYDIDVSVTDFGSDNSSDRYGVSLQSVGTDQALIEAFVSNPLSRTHCSAVQSISTDNVTVSGSFACARLFEFDQGSTGIRIVDYRNVSATTVFQSYPGPGSVIREFISQARAGLGAETLYSVPARGQGQLNVWTGDNVNNTDKIYGITINFSRAGTATVEFAEGIEINGTAFSWGTSGADIQYTAAAATSADNLIAEATVHFT